MSRNLQCNNTLCTSEGVEDESLHLVCVGRNCDCVTHVSGILLCYMIAGVDVRVNVKIVVCYEGMKMEEIQDRLIHISEIEWKLQ